MEQAKEPVLKLLEDNPSDFKFHAAYLAYSEAWDENPSEETRITLNELISSLRSPEGDYERFYSSLGQFRKQSSDFHPRARIQSTRKSDWRRSEQKNARNARQHSR